MNSLTKSILIDVLQPMAKQSSKAVESNIHLMADRIMGIARITGLCGAALAMGMCRMYWQMQ